MKELVETKQIWDLLSPNTREMCRMLVVSAPIEMLRAVFVEEEGYKLQEMLDEAVKMGAIVETTYVQELKEKLIRLKPNRDITTPEAILHLQPEEVEFNSVARSLRLYEAGVGDFSTWEATKYVIANDFKSFVEN